MAVMRRVDIGLVVTCLWISATGLPVPREPGVDWRQVYTAEVEAAQFFPPLPHQFSWSPVDQDRVAAHSHNNRTDLARYCVASRIGRLYYQHLRKAGGTSMRSYLGSARCDFQPALPGLVQEMYAFNLQLLNEPGTLLVTALRHPVARVVSSYFFEGRWEQKDSRRSDADAISMLEWFHKLDLSRQRGGMRIWIEAQNYYIQVLSYSRERRPLPRIVPTHASDEDRWQEPFDVAMHTLEQFDAVVITEWFSQPAQAEWLRRTLGLNSPFPYFKIPTPKVGNFGRYNHLHPSVNNSDLELLFWLNDWDLRLYDYARHLTHSRITSMLGPSALVPPTTVDLDGPHLNRQRMKSAHRAERKKRRLVEEQTSQAPHKPLLNTSCGPILVAKPGLNLKPLYLRHNRAHMATERTQDCI